MKNVGMLEIIDFPAGIAAPSDQSERQNGYPLDTATSLLLHDLRSPLSAICGCAEMLLHGNLGPAAIPFTLAGISNELTQGDRVLLMGIGSGLNASSSEIVW